MGYLYTIKGQMGDCVGNRGVHTSIHSCLFIPAQVEKHFGRTRETEVASKSE